MSVSVIIPTYNSEPFIRQTIASVLAQTLPPTEIIVSDDCSSDATCAIVREIGVHGSPIPIRVVQTATRSGGPAAPSNLAITQSRGEYVALLDHDDLMEPRKLELQLASLKHSPQSLLSFGDFITFGSSQSASMNARMREELINRSVAYDGYYLVPPKVMLQMQIMDVGVVQSCSNLVFHRSLWPKAGPFSAKYFAISDYAFKLRAAPLSHATFIPTILFRKRVHPDNLYTKAPGATLIRDLRFLQVQAIRRHPGYAIRSPDWRRWFKWHIIETIQSRWWHDDFRDVVKVWLEGFHMLGAEFLGDTLRWIAAKATSKFRTRVSR